MRVLGVDPGTVCTGWSIFNNNEPELCGKIQVTSGWKQSKRLAHMMWGIETVIDEYAPDIMVIEDQYVGKNKRSSLVTARAKGIAIAVAFAHGIKVIEYAPAEIKLAVTGKGNASKSLVTETILTIYSDSEIVKSVGPYSDKGKKKTDDIYDAIGINHTYCVLGEEKTVDVEDKKTKEKTTKIVSRAI